MPALRRIRTAIFANVFGYTTEDYEDVIRVLDDAEGIAGYELNVSCPNTRHGGIYFSSDPVLLSDLVGRIRLLAHRPLIVKLSPNGAPIEPLPQPADQTAADPLTPSTPFLLFS